MTTVPKQLNPFFETMITTESLHKLANFRNTKENLQIKRYYSNCLFTAATIDRDQKKKNRRYISHIWREATAQSIATNLGTF